MGSSSISPSRLLATRLQNPTAPPCTRRCT
jgi:hypothetical protein